ncbi:MAG: hypothetical protein KY475_00405 [Planctomycetes bacterium]|nr:hypothetical protein [Planctomycetota bacterium]
MTSASTQSLSRDWHAPFTAMLPKNESYLNSAFRNLNRDAKEEAVQEGLANALVAYRRFCERGKQDLAYPTVLAKYAASQVADGRQVAEKLNALDVTSRHCQRRKGICVQRLDRFDEDERAWREILVEDRCAGPADTAAIRIDFAAFLHSLSERERRIALKLATGEATGAMSRLFGVSAARISQLRREFMEKWQRFHGEPVTTTT